MTPETIFRIQLIFGYVAWLLFFGAYVMPKLRSMSWIDAQRAIATLHSFRFFGLVFILPGVVGTLPANFGPFSAYGDFVTASPGDHRVAYGAEMPSVFRVFVVAFNVAGAADILIDYYHAVVGGPAVRGRAVRRCLCDPDALCAGADDYARHCILPAAAPSEGDGACSCGTDGRVIKASATWRAVAVQTVCHYTRTG